MITFRRAIIKFITPLAWRLSANRQANALLEFSLVEKDSASQLLDALNLLDDPRAKAGLFQHVLEEYHHADLFENVCEDLSPTPLIAKVLPRDRLVCEGRDFDKLQFLSYVYVGEKNVNRDFSMYARVAKNRAVAEVFEKVQADEANHEGDTLAVLRSLANHRSDRLRLSLLKSEVRLWYRAYVGYMKNIGGYFLMFWLGLLYFSFGWVVAPACRERLNLGSKDQLGLFVRAQEEFPK